MLLGNKTRPTSAAGKIETQNVPSLLSELRPVCGATARSLSRQSRCRGGNLVPSGRSDLSVTHSEKIPKPEWLERELLRQKDRRHSFTYGDNEKFTQHHVHSLCISKFKIEQKVSLESLTKLKLAFEEFEKAGTRFLDLPHFRLVIKKCLGLRAINDAQIHELFMKIDYSGRSSIGWDEFCTYMQLEYTEKEESVIRGKQAEFTLPASIKPLTHGELILRIHPTPDGAIVTVREDGTVNYWSSKLQMRKNKSVFYERPIGRTPKWATDFITMPQYNKLIIGTGDREIQLYELSSLEPYCQINSLETMPLKLDYCYTGPDECAIIYGDTQGCVNIILMTSVGETLRMWKKLTKVENVPSIGIDYAVQSPNVTYIRWKVHQDWVTELKYIKSIPAIVSTSNHEDSALVIGCIRPSTNVEQQLKEIKEMCEGKSKKGTLSISSPQLRAPCDQTVFSIYKGVKTFDLCKKHNLLVTGGMDRIIRMWNPHVPGRPTGILKGHTAPIFYLCISSEDSRIFSVSTDNTAKIWDIQDQCCLFDAHPKASCLRGELSACLYFTGVKSLYVATDSLFLLSLKTKSQPEGSHIVSHKEAVLCCGYSQEFRQVVSCTEASIVKVWDVDTGSQLFEYGGAHGVSAITCMAFDLKGRRLVTGGRDGCLKIWNFHNGHCLKILRREDECREICDCCYLQVHRNTFVMSVGWGRRIDVYLDILHDTHHVHRPQPSWQEDLKKGHKEDILCIAQCPPSLIATGSYDGEIIVWNVVSGHILCRFLTPLPPHTDQVVNRSVLNLVFLKTRALDSAFTSAASLLSSGAEGDVHFWNVLNAGKYFASFKASRHEQQVTKLVVTQDDRLLFAADHVGYIYVYDIKECAITNEQKPPKTMNFWRAHINSITGLQIIENDQVLLTSSLDCTVRLWSIHGEFIGTFGQPEQWSLHTASSWQHPAVPYEVLVDPLSMPAHTMLKGNVTSLDEPSSTKTEDTSSEFDSRTKIKSPLPSSSDQNIRGEINTAFYPECGKRLRHEIFKHSNKPLNHGGLKAYHNLRYFEVVNVPTTCEKPDLSLAGIDPFRSSSLDEKTAGDS
ncbi:WD repeat-containing protein on Y chromosome [Hemibagrus wyckioides]|uniref:WD repeat-containing protein on Y chromosome n=1 Tax=Hemibagrus wyckioides TaxID=337641 RepID=UPI00266D4431|nr:WD repeat-containing protein on Y chromosome [Hemibagrus wyckioides]